MIGESTSRKHMSLYGYPRETTPQLDALKAANRNLTVFNNVVASRPYTIEVLQQVLTFADQEHPDRFLTDPSLMNLMKQAGYKTFWITNQQTMTKRNTMLTTFAQQTDAQFYLNNQRSQNASQLDGAVLAPFAKVLDDPAPKKFIVVHLLGTHMNYKYRYPADYARFVDRQGAPAALSDDQVEVYNSYDNAVLYNDYVVSSLIKGFANSDPERLPGLPLGPWRGSLRRSPARPSRPQRRRPDPRHVHRALPGLDFAQLAADPSARPAGPGRPTLQQRRPDPYLVRPRRPQL